MNSNNPTDITELKQELEQERIKLELERTKLELEQMKHDRIKLETSSKKPTELDESAPTKPDKWYENKRIIIYLLVLFPPVGLVLLWRHTKLNIIGKILFTFYSFFVFSLLLSWIAWEVSRL